MSSSEEDLFDKFMNFESIKVHTPTEPKSIPPVFVEPEKTSKQFQRKERDQEGTEYAEAALLKLEKSMAMNFSSLDLTVAGELETLDESSFTLNSVVQHRTDLSIFKSREVILRAIHKSPVVCIKAPTGTGKTTQVPQYIYDHCLSRNQKCKILITQPRKIAAITVAHRVAEERHSQVGKEIGFQVGLNRNVDIDQETESDVIFCTTGIVLQKLIHEKSIARYSHIIIDEVHERDLNIDFLLIIIRRLMASAVTRTKIILMSATMDLSLFTNYFKIAFDEGESILPPIINLSSMKRKFEISMIYIEDFKTVRSRMCLNKEESNQLDSNVPCISENKYEFALTILMFILEKHFQGDKIPSKVPPTVLIFLPGLYEIECFHKKFFNRRFPDYLIEDKPEIFVLHSSLSTEEQKKAFTITSKVKIVLSTNIAESSVTIPHVTYIMDFCLTKQLEKSQGSHISKLTLAWASKNNCEQRAGRCGRTCPGTVIRLVTKKFYNSLPDHSPPEMQRAPLEKVVIDVKILDMGKPLDLLGLALDPPNKFAVVDAVLRLKELGGLLPFDSSETFNYDDGELTFLGSLMSSLPIDVSITRFIVIGYLFSVLKETVIIGAGLSIKSIFLQSFTNRLNDYEKKLTFANGSGSDCLAILNAFNLWMKNKRDGSEDEAKYCLRHGLDLKNLQEMQLLVNEIKKRLEKTMLLKPMLNPPSWNEREKIFILKICIAGAFGAANFFLPSNATDDKERDAYKVLNGLDVFKTVYFNKIPRNIIGELYENELRSLIQQKLDVNELPMTCTFGSEKVLVTFESKHQEAETNNLEKECKSFGKFPLEVYKVLKLHQLKDPIVLPIMKHKDSLQFMKNQNIIELSSEQNYVKNPELYCLPTIDVSACQGYVTMVENAHKFYFRPIYMLSPKLTERSDYPKKINLMMTEIVETADLQLVDNNKSLKIGQLILVKYQDKLQRSKVIAMSENPNIIDVFLIDLAFTVFDVKINDAFTFSQEVQDQLMKFPPAVFECRLSEIQPCSIKSHQGLWTQESTKMLQDIIGEKATIEIFSVHDDIAAVQLKTHLINWNQKLVDSGFAEYCEESYVNKMNRELRNYHQQSEKAFVEPEDEFKLKIDKSAPRREISSPPSDLCTLKAKLNGPFHPLEMELSAASRYENSKVSVDPLSVNSVILDDDVLSFSRKFLVAADITLSSRNELITAHETTMMPNLTGLAILLALIFSPTVEIRRDKKKNRFAQILAGLGFDKERQQPYYRERDAVFNVDFDLKQEDIIEINILRKLMSEVLMKGLFLTVPDLTDGVKEQILHGIQKKIVTILNKKRVSKDVVIISNNFNWNIDQEDLIHKEDKFKNRHIFPPLDIPNLYKMTDETKNNWKSQEKDMQSCQINTITVRRRTCNFCNFQWDNETDLKMHLQSKKHKTRTADMNIEIQ